MQSTLTETIFGSLRSRIGGNLGIRYWPRRLSPPNKKAERPLDAADLELNLS
jgi:hypothetical protein